MKNNYLKERIKIVGVETISYKDGLEILRRKTPDNWLEEIGKNLLSLELYKKYEKDSVEYKFESWILPYIPLSSALLKIGAKLNISYLNVVDFFELRRKFKNLPYDILVIFNWPYEFIDGNAYEGNLSSIKGSGSIIPVCVANDVKDAINCAIHEIIEYYFSEKIWLKKNFCKNPKCCMYYDEKSFSHILKPDQDGLCIECKRKLYEEWIPSLKNYRMK